MRENRTYGSEGGEAQAFPTPIDRVRCRDRRPGAGTRCAGRQRVAGIATGSAEPHPVAVMIHRTRFLMTPSYTTGAGWSCASWCRPARSGRPACLKDSLARGQSRLGRYQPRPGPFGLTVQFRGQCTCLRGPERPFQSQSRPRWSRRGNAGRGCRWPIVDAKGSTEASSAYVALPSVQFSRTRPSTCRKSSVLLVTSISPSARAWAAIFVSMQPIGRPRRRRAAASMP
jgi:hypothetical protein